MKGETDVGRTDHNRGQHVVCNLRRPGVAWGRVVEREPENPWFDGAAQWKRKT